MRDVVRGERAAGVAPSGAGAVRVAGRGGGRAGAGAPRGTAGAVRSRIAALRPAPVPDDRGSGAGAVIIFALVFLSLTAFVIDGGMSISQRERAADIAEQAARYAAQDIDREALYDDVGGPAPINFANCDARVKAFAREMHLSGPDVAASHCVAADADRVQVRIQLTYSPVFTGMFYGQDVKVHGQSAAENEVG